MPVVQDPDRCYQLSVSRSAAKIGIWPSKRPGGGILSGEWYHRHRIFLLMVIRSRLKRTVVERWLSATLRYFHDVGRVFRPTCQIAGFALWITRVVKTDVLAGVNLTTLRRPIFVSVSF
jgi:hypothetical protein